MVLRLQHTLCLLILLCLPCQYYSAQLRLAPAVPCVSETCLMMPNPSWSVQFGLAIALGCDFTAQLLWISAINCKFLKSVSWPWTICSSSAYCLLISCILIPNTTCWSPEFCLLILPADLLLPVCWYCLLIICSYLLSAWLPIPACSMFGAYVFPACKSVSIICPQSHPFLFIHLVP